MKTNHFIFIFIVYHVSIVKCAFYSAKSNEKTCYKDEVSKTESPSLISCTLYCQRLHGESIALFERGECRCVLKGDDDKENKKGGKLTSTSMQRVKIWRQLELVDQKELEIEKGNLITIIPRMGKDYVFSLDFRIIGFPNSWANLIHMTSGLNTGDYGSRTIGIWSSQYANQVVIHGAVNLVGGYGYAYVTEIFYELNRWERIRISQLKDSYGIHRFDIEINGQLVHSVVNNHPAIFDNVKCYIANPWGLNVKGYVKNARLELYD